MKDNSFIDFVEHDDSCINPLEIPYPISDDSMCHRDNYDELYYRKSKILELLTQVSGGTFLLTDDEISTIKTWSSSKISTELNKKVDKIIGKGLSTNDYTNNDKTSVGTISTLKNDIDFIKSSLAVHPSYIAPTMTITSTPSVSNLEVGQTITVTINGVFNKNDAGNLSVMAIKKDGTTIGTAFPFVDSNVVLTTTPKIYQASTTYTQGPIKNNNFGDPDPVGRIEAGTINSNTISYRGYYFIPYGSSVSIPTTSVQARSLPQNQLSSSSNTLNLKAKVGMLYQILYLPIDKSLSKVIDTDALNLDITSEYVLDANIFIINDIGSTPRPYKAYVRSQDVSYSTEHNHQITLSNI